MFDFFRKDKGTAKPVVPDAPTPVANRPVAAPAKPGGPAAPASGRPAPALADPATLSGSTLSGPTRTGLEVEESELELAPEVEEAVVLYASGHPGEATAALNRFILNNPDSRDPLPWRMLFDIYETTGQRQPFEDLAMDYAVRFEQSPPTWRLAERTPETGAGGEWPSFAFAAGLSPQDKAALEHFLREAATAEGATVDFSKTLVPDNEVFGRAMLDCISRLAETGKAIQLLGGDAFVVRLNASRSTGRLAEPLWLLLLLLLQLQGKAEEFDTVALDYAIQFEISPPSYTPPKKVATSPAPARPAPSGPSGLVFPLHGQIGPAEAGVFEKLREFAMPLPGVEVDLSQVARIDFMVVGMLMDAVMSLVQAGRHVVFKDGSEMVCLLLRMVGVGQFATIQPRIRK
ncbi:hypothetical protein EZJ19_09065 [Parasulfuritortus cantonensis]|uniref:STAS domain-containing protein n=1 Tax=Parasulfuritortus cantonensis TaxID=2528202 RepID=A0A4V2NVT3_9PROT|nr:hypothetical protein [Parasulfuritortus cantonensis]TCJ14722.1 hypothetical protein EZJ19_09065 [Parasulfuritortus cantonensis]